MRARRNRDDKKPARDGPRDQMTALLLVPSAWATFLTLTALELVLGLDNEMLNIRVRKRGREPVDLGGRYADDDR